MTLLLMTVASPLLEASLKVYRIKGDITMRSGNTWKPLQRRAIIGSADMLRIPADARIDILDTDTRRLYSSVSSGDISVKALISAATADAADMTRKTNRRILASVSENGAARKSRYGSTGLSMHDTDAGTNSLASFDPSSPYLLQLMKLHPDSVYNDYSDIILIRRDIAKDDDTFNFAVFNTLDIPLYINIINQNDSGDINFYFNENPLVNPRGETVITGYMYILPEEPSGYIVIASDKPFSADDIRSMIKGDSPSTGGDFFYSLLRI